MSSHTIAVLFDLDGLLVDTEAIQSEAYKAVMKDRYDVLPDVLDHGTVHIPGEKTHETWARLLDAHGLQGHVGELTDQKRQTAMELIKQEVKPMSGALGLIKTLKGSGVPIAVVTSAQQERALLVLRKMGIDTYVDVLVSANDTHEVKPDPEAYITAASKLGISPARCVVLEDAEVGVLAGRRAGAKVIAIPNAFTKHLDFSQADLVLGSLNEVTIAKLYALVSDDSSK